MKACLYRGGEVKTPLTTAICSYLVLVFQNAAKGNTSHELSWKEKEMMNIYLGK